MLLLYNKEKGLNRSMNMCIFIMVIIENVSFRATMWKTGTSKVITIPHVLATLLDPKKEYEFVIKEVK